MSYFEIGWTIARVALHTLRLKPYELGSLCMLVDLDHRRGYHW